MEKKRQRTKKETVHKVAVCDLPYGCSTKLVSNFFLQTRILLPLKLNKEQQQQTFFNNSFQ